MGSKFISVVSMLANVHRFLCHPDVILFRVNTRSVVQGGGSKLRLNKLGPSLKFTAPRRNLPSSSLLTFSAKLLAEIREPIKFALCLETALTIFS